MPKKQGIQCLTPSASLLSKLGSIIVHAEELTGKKGHQFDLIAFASLLKDSEVRQWIEEMDELALIPKKR